MGFFSNFKKRNLLAIFPSIIINNAKEFKEGGLINSWSLSCSYGTRIFLNDLFIDGEYGHNPFKARSNILDKDNINEIYKFFAMYSLAMFLHSNDTIFTRFDLPKEKEEEFENEIISIFEFSKKNLHHYQSMKDNLNKGQTMNVLYDLVFKEGLKVTDFENDLEILNFKVAQFPILMTGHFIPLYNSMLTELTKLK